MIDAAGISDPLHWRSDPDEHWTTANLGEAMPGVATPLSATVWGDAVDRGLVAGAVAMGALAAGERETLGPPGDRLTRLFYGRAAVKADFLGLLGDRMPGTTGADVVRELFGEVPPTMRFAPTRRRYPVVAVALPRTFVMHPRTVRALAAEYDIWWRAAVEQLGRPGGGAEDARRMLAEARRRLERAVIVQSVAVMTCVQPVYEALVQTVHAAGAGDLSALSAAPGGAESAVVADLWRASRGELSVAAVAGRHGFHGPAEGELSSRVWREDDAILARLIEQYRGRDDREAPAAKEAVRADGRAREEAALLAAVGAVRRPGVRGLLALVRTRIPLRGVAKRSMLQALDVARAAARVLGTDLAAGGSIAEPADVFYLTLEEAIGPGVRRHETVAARRAMREAHAAVTLREQWRGDPVAVGPAVIDAERIEGTGVSAGVAEGRARVVSDPSFAEVEPDEILIAPTTDPSWSAIMFISAALVVDIGGALSHAAVVARELGIPCVVNTRSGTRQVRTGDRVRVDGASGVVTILERAP